MTKLRYRTISNRTVAAKSAAGPTVAELAARYMDDHVAVHCKLTSARTLRTVVDVHIVPALGRTRVAAVGREHVTGLHHALRDTPAQANIVIDTLSHMFRMAEAWGLVTDFDNPCKSVVRYRARKRERFLTDAEFERLGQVLDDVAFEGGASAPSVAAIRLLMLTGCRCNEILTLRWQDVDLQARELRLRDLRHSFASRALALGESLPMIGKLLGHSRIESTARYAHLARRSVHESAARVAESIAGDIL